MSEIGLNPNAVDIPVFAETLKAKGRIRLQGLLSSEHAQIVHAALETGTDWVLEAMSDTGVVRCDRQALSTMNAHAIQNLLQGAIDRAQSDFSFVRLGFDLDTGLAPSHPLTGIVTMIRSEAFHDLCSALAGFDALTLSHLSAHAYRPGDFMSLHTDTGTRLGFEWSFSPGWRPDEGGQLLFHSPSGDIEAGILPRLDDLALFTGDKPRSVATIAAYARAPRLSIVGRFV